MDEKDKMKIVIVDNGRYDNKGRPAKLILTQFGSSVKVEASGSPWIDADTLLAAAQSLYEFIKVARK